MKIIKLKFFYEVLLKGAANLFPESLHFMFVKAVISLDYFENKYLALTAVTHISTFQKRMSYKEHLQSQISVNYFLKSILSSSSAQSSGRKETLSARQQHTELDSTVLLEQALKIDEILNCIKLCSLKIAMFWQLAGSETVSGEQIMLLQRVSLEVSEMLRVIRGYVK